MHELVARIPEGEAELYDEMGPVAAVEADVYPYEAPPRVSAQPVAGAKWLPAELAAAAWQDHTAEQTWMLSELVARELGPRFIEAGAADAGAVRAAGLAAWLRYWADRGVGVESTER